MPAPPPPPPPPPPRPDYRPDRPVVAAWLIPTPDKPNPRAWMLPFALGWVSAIIGAIAAIAVVLFT